MMGAEGIGGEMESIFIKPDGQLYCMACGKEIPEQDNVFVGRLKYLKIGMVVDTYFCNICGIQGEDTVEELISPVVGEIAEEVALMQAEIKYRDILKKEGYFDGIRDDS